MSKNTKKRIPWNKEKKAPQISRAKMGNKNPMWNGGKTISYGYILVKNTNHPFANNRGYVREHRLVMEKYLGRFLLKEEHIHHINGNKKDNRLENLMLFSNEGSHMSLHRNIDLINKKPLFGRI